MISQSNDKLYSSNLFVFFPFTAKKRESRIKYSELVSGYLLMAKSEWNRRDSNENSVISSYTKIVLRFQRRLCFPRSELVAISSWLNNSPINFLVRDESVVLSLTTPIAMWAGRNTPKLSTSSMYFGGTIRARYKQG